MRHIILAGILPALVWAAPVLAADPDMFVGGGVSHITPSDLDPTSWDLQGSIEHQFDSDFGVQGDAVLHIDSYHDGDPNFDEQYTYLDFAGHAFYREPEAYLLGGFVQLGTSMFDIKLGGEREDRRTFVGVEGQAYIDAITIYGQLGLVNSYDVEYPDDSGSGVFATGELRYFASSNLKFDLHGGLSSVAPDGMSDMATTNTYLGIGVEHRFEDSPFSIYGRITHFAYDTDGFDGSANRIMIGIKGNFGTDSLLERDRSGASLKPVEAVLSNYITVK